MDWVLDRNGRPSQEVADQLFMDYKEEQLVKKATKMKSNWCTLPALSSAYLFLFPSQIFLKFLLRSPSQKAYLIFANLSTLPHYFGLCYFKDVKVEKTRWECSICRQSLIQDEIAKAFKGLQNVEAVLDPNNLLWWGGTLIQNVHICRLWNKSFCARTMRKLICDPIFGFVFQIQIDLNPKCSCPFLR